MASMKVVFDGYWWKSGPFSNRTVLVNLVCEWRKFHPHDQLTVIHPGKTFRILNDSGIQFIQVPWLPHPLFNLVYIWPYSVFGSSDYSLVQNFGILSRKSLVFIHDVIFLEKREWFSRLELLYFSIITRIAKFRRVEIVTSSKTESRRIELYIKSKRVTPVGLGVRCSLTDSVPTRPNSLHNSQGKFYFTVGRANPRKNLTRLVEAHGLACKEIGDFPDLIIVGITRDEMSSLNLDPALNASVKFLTNLSDSELRWLYENGEFTVFLSLDEGFGLPIIEADFFQIPQLVSDIEVFREIASESVVFVSPNSVYEIKCHIVKMSNSKRKIEPTSHSINRSWEPVISIIRGEFKKLGDRTKK